MAKKDDEVFKPVTGFMERDVDASCLMTSGWRREEYRRADTGYKNTAGTATHVRFWKGPWEVDVRLGWMFRHYGVTPDRQVWRSSLVRCPDHTLSLDTFTKYYSGNMRPIDAFRKFIRTLRNKKIMPVDVVNMNIT